MRPTPNDLLQAEIEQIASTSQQLLEKEIRALTELKNSINCGKLEEALVRLLNCAGIVLVTGSGTSSSIARRLAHTLTCSGLPAYFLDSGQSQHGYSAIIRQRDVLIAISRGGETDEVNFLAGIAKNKGAKVISILENSQSALGKLSDVILVGAVKKENEPINTIPLASTIVQAAVGDILCAAINRINNFKIEDFVKFHPGGAVGKRYSS
jgi:arabinose-5-phosphate isomerase